MTQVEALAVARFCAAWRPCCRGAEVVFIRYSDLIDDWRPVGVHRGARANLPPATALRRSTTFSSATAAASGRRRGVRRAASSALRDEVRAVRRMPVALRRRCGDGTSIRCDSRRGGLSTAVGDAAAASVGFGPSIENNAIRDQALPVVRKYPPLRRAPSGGAHLCLARAPLRLVSTPRRNGGCRSSAHIDAPPHDLSTAPANRVFAGGYASGSARPIFLVVLDSDTVWLDEPGPARCRRRRGARWIRGSATRGPAIASAPPGNTGPVVGTTLDRLPWSARHRQRAHPRVVQRGLTVVPGQGILTCCADLFAASLAAGMRPYRDRGMNIRVDRRGPRRQRILGSSQAALTLAIWGHD